VEHSLLWVVRSDRGNTSLDCLFVRQSLGLQGPLPGIGVPTVGKPRVPGGRFLTDLRPVAKSAVAMAAEVQEDAAPPCNTDY
jgi:hypothetical protein